jgi:hypothetical protein
LWNDVHFGLKIARNCKWQMMDTERERERERRVQEGDRERIISVVVESVGFFRDLQDSVQDWTMAPVT